MTSGHHSFSRLLNADWLIQISPYARMDPTTNSLTMTNLDSGQICTMDQHVWDRDANQWLDELMADLEEPPLPETADSWMCDEDDVCDWLDEFMVGLEDPSSWENRIDVHDLLHDMTPDDWEHVVDDVINHFDVDLLS